MMNRSQRITTGMIIGGAAIGITALWPRFTYTREFARSAAASGPSAASRSETKAVPAAEGSNSAALARSSANSAEVINREKQALYDADVPAQAAPPTNLMGGSTAGRPSQSEASAKRPQPMAFAQRSRSAYAPVQKLAPSSMAGEPTAAASMPMNEPAPMQNPNVYISSTYMGGSGARDRVEKLIQQGVLVDGRRVKLESFSRTYAQSFPIPTNTALHVTADTERSRIIQDGDHTYLQVGLQAMMGELPRRPALNIALVIDRSGSMQQDHKLDNAKRAAVQLVNSLRPDDIFSLTVFDNSARLLVPAQHVLDKASVKNRIARLYPGGGTNIYSGLQSGYREAEKYANPESVNRVILLSDGEVTAGVTSASEFQRLTAAEAENEIQTTSVGLGLEFNEDLMMAIARNGKGNYHFIKDGSDTQTVFAKELDELTHVVAKAVKLRIQLADGIGLVRVLGAQTLNAAQTARVKSEEKRIDRRAADELGIAANRQDDRDEPGIKLLIPDFYRGDSHIVMLELTVPPGQGARKVADVFLKYKDLVTRTNQTEQTGASIVYTADRSQMITSINRAVKKNLLGFQTGEALADAGSLVSRGQVANAVKRVNERMVVLDLAAREWNDADLDRDGKLLGRYEAVLRQIHTNPQLARTDLGQYVSRSLTYAGYKMTR